MESMHLPLDQEDYMGNMERKREEGERAGNKREREKDREKEIERETEMRGEENERELFC